MQNLFLNLVLVVFIAATGTANGQQTRPNIVLILAEDLSPKVGFAGDELAYSPNLDALAKESLVFTNTFTAAGVCAPSRSALIMGAHQQTLGTMHMRTSSADRLYGPGHNYEAVPPAEIKAFPELLRKAGYFTANNVKTDYQFGKPFTIWDESSTEASWRNRPEGKPFFYMTMQPYTHEVHTWPPSMNNDRPSIQKDYVRNAKFDEMKTHFTDRGQIDVPPYYPDTPKVRETIARQYDNVQLVDSMTADLLAQLEKDGLLENTIIIWSTDHGDGLPRAKRSLYDTGLKVPMLIRFPDGYKKSEQTDELVSFVDLAPTILSLAGAEIPNYMQGQVFLGPDKAEPRKYIYAAADRFDEWHSRYKAARSENFKYIRNYRSDIPFYERLDYRENQPLMEDLWLGLKEGTLTDIQRSYFETGVEEELYDLKNDPYEVHNLAGDENYLDILEEHRRALDSWVEKTGDLSAIAEPDLIERMWPGKIQPKTAPAIPKIIDDKLYISSATEEASIGYREFKGDNNKDRWILYSAPVDTGAIKAIETKAIRYGYKESELTTIKVDN